MTLQHNPVAMAALHEKHGIADAARDRALDAAGRLCSAEAAVESLERSLRAAERHNAAQTQAAAALPDVVAAPGGGVEALRRKLEAARDRLARAKLEHATVCEEFQQAQRDARDLQHRIYAESSAIDPVRVEVS